MLPEADKTSKTFKLSTCDNITLEDETSRLTDKVMEPVFELTLKVTRMTFL